MIKRILLNKWLGDRFENDTKCDDCGKFTSVMVFEVRKGGLGMRMQLCPHCLNKADKEVTKKYCERMYHLARTGG